MPLIARLVCIGVVSFAMPALFAVSALAQEAPDDPRVQEARALFERGSELTRQRRFSEAAESYARSAELVERASTLFNLGLCHYALGKHLEAARAFERFFEIADASEHASMIAEAREMHAHGQRQIGELTLELLPPSATVTLNGELLAGEGAMRHARVNAGTHVVRADAPHHAPQLVEIRVTPGAHVRRAIALETTFRPSSLVIDAEAGLVRIDGVPGELPLDREIDPGTHRIEIEREGYPPYSAEVEVGEAERVRVRLDSVVREASVERPRWRHPLLWAAIGAVVAGVAATGIAVGLRNDEPTLSVSGGHGVQIRP